MPSDGGTNPGRVSHFENGSIYWHQQYTNGYARAVPGLVRDYWLLALGGYDSIMGWPSSYPQFQGTQISQAFHGGYIWCDTGTYTCTWSRR